MLFLVQRKAVQSVTNRRLSLTAAAAAAASKSIRRWSSISSFSTASVSSSPHLDNDDDVSHAQPPKLVSPLMMWGKTSYFPKPATETADVASVPLNLDYAQAIGVPKRPEESTATPNIKKIVCGPTDTAWILENGRCFVMGQNKEGQLGLGHQKAVTDAPTELRLANNDSDSQTAPHITDMSIGPKFSAIIDSNHDLYTCGYGGSAFSGVGCLGLGSAESYHTPQLVTSLVEDGVYAQQAVAHESHLTVLTTEGEVLTAGAGSYGRLGNFETTDQLYLEPVELLTTQSGVVSIAGGKSFTLALTKDGVIYGWGRNHKGQLGTGLGLAVDMYAMQAIPEPIETDELVGRRVVQIAAGQAHAACITDGGELFVWGMQLYLEPVRVNELLHTQIVSVACGQDYTLAVDKDGYMYSFGKGKNGCLGQGGSVKKANQAGLVEALEPYRVTHVSAGWDHAACLVEEREC